MVDINRAEPWLLEALPGIGPSLAEAIVGYREEKGLFRSPQEVQLVPGIGAGLYEKMKDFITVGE
jgi:competence protein ComEA